jgi:hypothetical protein
VDNPLPEARAVAVADQEARRFFKGEGLHHLPGDPVRGCQRVGNTNNKEVSYATAY